MFRDMDISTPQHSPSKSSHQILKLLNDLKKQYFIKKTAAKLTSHAKNTGKAVQYHDKASVDS